MKKLLAVSLCLGLVGCATYNSNINCDQLGEIISDPPGAKIEINNQYIGETPITVRFTRQAYIDYNVLYLAYFGEKKCVPTSYTIIAYPTQAGQFVQKKYLGPYDGVPDKIYFNMSIGPVTPSMNVNVNQQ